MSRFSQVVYSSYAQTATIGSGLIWDDVYDALQPYGVSVVGGRTSGVGVAGFALGGGKFAHFLPPPINSLIVSPSRRVFVEVESVRLNDRFVT
jgi:hypothetical protein